MNFTHGIFFVLLFSFFTSPFEIYSQDVNNSISRYQRFKQIDEHQFALLKSTQPVAYLYHGEWLPIAHGIVEAKVTNESSVFAYSTGSDFNLNFHKDGSILIDSSQYFPPVTFFAETRMNGSPVHWDTHTVDGNRILSSAQTSNINRLVDTRYAKFKTTYSLMSRPAISDSVYWVEEELILPSGWSLSKAQKGHLTLKSPIGEVKGFQKKPVTFDGAYDYATRTGDLVESEYQIQDLGANRYRVRYGIPANFLEAPERVYPVLIDPVFTFTWTATTAMETSGVLTTDLTTLPCFIHDSYELTASFYDAFAGAWRSDVTNLTATTCGTTVAIPTCGINSGGICNLPNQSYNIDCVSDDVCVPEVITTVFEWDNFFGFGLIDGVFNLELTFTTPTFDAGGVAAPQSIASGETPATLISTSAANVSTPCATIFYQWQQMDGACDCGAAAGGWTDIPGATGPTLPSADMGPLTADRCYRRIMTSECDAASDWDAISAPANRSSNCVQVSVSPLPVQFESVHVRHIPKGALLTWKTLSEHNSEGFWVERHTADGTWQKLAFLASDHTGSIAAYEYLDTQTQPNTTYYYRLEQVDLDGTLGYSDVVHFQTPQTAHQRLEIVPNPSLNGIFEVPQLKPGATIDVYNTSGQYEGAFSLDSRSKLDLDALSQGIYQFLHVDENGVLHTARAVSLKAN